MANLSQKRRLRMLSFLEVLRKNNQDDVSSLRAINEIEQTLKEKNMDWYGKSILNTLILW